MIPVNKQMRKWLSLCCEPSPLFTSGTDTPGHAVVIVLFSGRAEHTMNLPQTRLLPTSPCPTLSSKLPAEELAFQPGANERHFRFKLWRPHSEAQQSQRDTLCWRMASSYLVLLFLLSKEFSPYLSPLFSFRPSSCPHL